MSQGKRTSARFVKVSIVVAVALAAGFSVYAKHARNSGKPAVRGIPGISESEWEARIPKLVDFGAGTCTPCKLMAPLLEKLRRDYEGQMQVVVVDTGEHKDAISRYDIRMIPTQILYDAGGRELFRHEGFFSTGHIVSKWRELGFEFRRPDYSPAQGAPNAAGAPRRASRATMGNLFEALTRAVEGTPALALLAAFLWGILSIVLSPCQIASIPLIVGFIDEQGRISTRRAFWISSLFAGGILVTLALVGAVTVAMGRMMGDVGRWCNYLVALVFLVVGLHLLDVVPAPWSAPGQIGMKRKGLLAAFLLGLIFGIALGPCTFAYMAPMLAVTFKLAATSLTYGIFLLLAFALGYCSLIVLAGTSTETVQRYLNWSEKSKGTVILKRICGLLVILAGLYLIHRS